MDPRDAFDRAEDQLAQMFNDGKLSLAEYNAEMRELGRDYAAQAEEAAEDAYWLAQMFNDGKLSLAEYNAKMRELGRDYAAQAEEAAEDAYWQERDRW